MNELNTVEAHGLWYPAGQTKYVVHSSAGLLGEEWSKSRVLKQKEEEEKSASFCLKSDLTSGELN